MIKKKEDVVNVEKNYLLMIGNVNIENIVLLNAGEIVAK